MTKPGLGKQWCRPAIGTARDEENIFKVDVVRNVMNMIALNLKRGPSKHSKQRTVAKFAHSNS